MAAPQHQIQDSSSPQPGGLLDELERRQDDVLNQLDDLDAKLNEVLKGLEPEKDDVPPEGFASSDASPAPGLRLAILDQAPDEELAIETEPVAKTPTTGESVPGQGSENGDVAVEESDLDDIDSEDSDSEDAGSAEDWA